MNDHNARLQSRPALGIGLALLGGLLISIDIPIIRLAEGNPWVVMFARGVGLSLVLTLVFLYAPQWTNTPRQPLKDRDWVIVAILNGVSAILFSFSVFHTSTANLVFILAFNPMIAALFAWWLIGERPSLITWLAIIATIIGVSIIVSGGLTGGTILGDITSLMAATSIALALTWARKSGKDMSLVGSLGGLIAAAFSLPLAIVYFEIPQVPAWLIFNALIIVPAASFTLTLAPKFIPAPQVAMFFLLETVLAPIWVWMIFFEVPTTNTLIGGAIVLTAIAVHGTIQLRKGQKEKAG